MTAFGLMTVVGGRLSGKLVLKIGARKILTLGLLLVPSDPPLTKVYVEPTTSCNLNCRTCIRK
jgi:hypothetical protein